MLFLDVSAHLEIFVFFPEKYFRKHFQLFFHIKIVIGFQSIPLIRVTSILVFVVHINNVQAFSPRQGSSYREGFWVGLDHRNFNLA